jgi:hypothetical protein
LEKLDLLLIDNYLAKLENLGGIDQPTYEELSRAEIMLDYMCGRTKIPKFIDE